MGAPVFRSLLPPFCGWLSFIARSAWKSHPTAFAQRLELWLSGLSPGCAWRSFLPATSREAGCFVSSNGILPNFSTAMNRLSAAKTWALLWGLIVTVGACIAFRIVAPPQLRTWPATASQLPLPSERACCSLMSSS